MASGITNVVIAGLGGQGVLTSSDILAYAAFAAGMDVNRVRQEFGDDFFMEGGYDKRALFRGRAEIDAEFARLHGALERGRMLLGVDHSVPPEVSWDNFRYYARRKRELLVEYARG